MLGVHMQQYWARMLWHVWFSNVALQVLLICKVLLLPARCSYFLKVGTSYMSKRAMASTVAADPYRYVIITADCMTRCCISADLPCISIGATGVTTHSGITLQERVGVAKRCRPLTRVAL